MVFDRQNMEKAVVPIRVDGHFQCTGVVVAPGKVVITLHGVDEEYQKKPLSEFAEEDLPNHRLIQIGKKGGTLYPATILRGNQHHDLVLLDVPGYEAEPVAIASEAPKAGDVVYSMGFDPKGTVEGKGEVDALSKGGPFEPPILMHNAPAQRGTCGGALLNKQNELIGIQFARGPSAVSARWVEELLRRTDHDLVSRGAEPVTEIDHLSLSSYSGYEENVQRKLQWLKARPESLFAVEKSMNGIENQPYSEEMAQLCKRFYDYMSKVGIERSPRTPSERYSDVAEMNAIESPLYYYYMGEALESAKLTLAMATDPAPPGYQIKPDERRRYEEMEQDAKHDMLYANQMLGRVEAYTLQKYPQAVQHFEDALRMASQLHDAEKKDYILRMLVSICLFEGRENAPQNASKWIKKAHGYFGDWARTLEGPNADKETKDHALELIRRTIDKPWPCGAGELALCEGEFERQELLRSLDRKGLSLGLIEFPGQGDKGRA